jgi:hypothetical protein
MSRSAVRVRSSALFITCKTCENKELRHEYRGLCQQYVSSRLYPKASSILSAAYLLAQMCLRSCQRIRERTACLRRGLRWRLTTFWASSGEPVRVAKMNPESS